MKDPLRLSDDLVAPEPDEERTVRGLEDAPRETLDTTAADGGHAIRSVHAKAHGDLTGTLAVPPDLAPELAEGLFARAGEHEAMLRFSTSPGDILDDGVTVPRGLELKVIDAEGERLAGAEGTSQDFVLVNGPAVPARSPREFLMNLRLLAETTDRAGWAKKALSLVLRTTERALETAGLESATLKTMGGAPDVHPLGQTCFSQTAFRHGDFVAKYALVPVSPSLTRHRGEEIDAAGRPDAIGEAMDRDTREGAMAWELRAQLPRDAERQPVEDPTVEWVEEDGPWQPVACLRAPPQGSFDAAAARRLDDSLRFSPWTGLAAHRPLGAIERARRATHRMSADFRARVNGCPVHQPASAGPPL